MPVLGICRGMQLVNVARGGSLYQDISLMEGTRQMHTQRQNRDYPIHKVVIRSGSRLSKILGQEEIFTNTLHHQCVNGPGKDLLITAWTGDKVPEAMESLDGRVILVQWHPEELTKTVPEMNEIFKDLVERSGTYRKNIVK